MLMQKYQSSGVQAFMTITLSHLSKPVPDFQYFWPRWQWEHWFQGVHDGHRDIRERLHRGEGLWCCKPTNFCLLKQILQGNAILVTLTTLIFVLHCWQYYNTSQHHSYKISWIIIIAIFITFSDCNCWFWSSLLDW